MSSLVVKVVKIDDVKTHTGSDFLDLIIVGGWQCVVKRGEYKSGDLVVYFPPDTVLSQTWTDTFGVTTYCSKCDQGMRIKQAKLRGEPSFGLLVKCPDATWEIGKDVAEFYGAKKYEAPVLGKQGDILGNRHPLFDKFTDIENMRNYPTIFQDGEEVICTEKIHGCVHEDTRIMLVNGEEIPISEIQCGDIVSSYNEETDSFVGRKVKAVLIQENTPLLLWFSLTFDNNRTLICTEDHPILTKNRGWVIAKDINEEDDIL